MQFKQLAEEVKKLDFPKDSYVIFGSGPIAIRGIRDSDDIDIIFRPEVWDEYEKKPEWEKKLFRNNIDYYLTKDGLDIEVFYNWGPGEWNVDELIEHADIIDGLPYASLNDVLKWKNIMGREKDKKDVELIETYMRDNG